MSQRDKSESEKINNSLGFAVKLLASGVFVGGRDPEDFIRNDIHAPYGFTLDELTVSLDEQRGRITLSLPGGLSRTAVHTPGLGCTLLPQDADGIFFDPVEVSSTLPDAETLDWPMGDRVTAPISSDGIDHDKLSTALDLAFDETAHEHFQRTRAMVVLHNGRIVGERYANGFSKTSKLVSWSMGKSITASLIGILVGEGHYGLQDRAPIDEWNDPADPRREITIAHLLRMSSGLKFNKVETADGFFANDNNHNFAHFGAVNVFDYAVAPPLEFPPNTVWRYRNCDVLSLGKIIKQTVQAKGEEYLTFPQRALFDRIGIRNMVLEPDPWGNFIMTGYDHGTARDWARLGQLYLQDGVWDGERIFPEGWVDFVRTPAPADPEDHYGGFFWLNAGNRFQDIPNDAYWADGARGQFTMIIPSHNVVIARMGHSLDAKSFDRYRERVIAAVLGAIKEPEG
jgi:CubicO group peptidase (beta-lactamase class C family)